MAIVTDVILLPQAGPVALGSYLAALADHSVEPDDLVVVAVEPGGGERRPSGLDGFLPAGAGEIIDAYGLTGRAGETAETIARVGDATVRVLFLGVGDRTPRALRRAGAEIGRRVADGKRAAVDVLADAPDEAVQALAEGILIGSYRFRIRSGEPRPAARGVARLLVAGSRGYAAAVERAGVSAGAVAMARDLANMPSGVKTPQWLADQSALAAREHGLRCRIWATAELESAGFGGILAVGSGSQRPPVLIELTYAPDGASRHVVLVGKGITFDSGGLSLKANDGMKLMKTDMAGGAAVIAAMAGLGRLGVAHRVTGLVAAAENMPSGSAYRPGDVITHYGGRTVEVLNTDAEGRLVLADALAYADAVLQPDEVVDVATLTGAVRIALGTSRAALYSTSEPLAAALLTAGEASGDLLWRMPLADCYAGALDSPVAELSNVARDDGQAGSILAALFLRTFAGPRPWAHLDIAGAGRSAVDEGELAKGATGFGARLLLRWLSESSPGQKAARRPV